MKRRFVLLAALLALAGSIASLGVQGNPAAGAGRSAAAAPLDRLCQDYASGTVTVEALGDSIVYGTGATSSQRTWGYRVGKLLESTGGALWMGAMPGTTVADYLPGAEWYGHVQFTRAVRPTVVLWDWRVNDQYRWEHGVPGGSSPSQLRDRYVQLAAHIRETAPDTTVIIVNPNRMLTNWGTAVESQYIAAMKEAKALIPGSLWVDIALYSPTTSAQNDIGLTHPDGIHQSDWGQAVTAAAVHQRIHATCTR